MYADMIFLLDVLESAVIAVRRMQGMISPVSRSRNRPRQENATTFMMSAGVPMRPKGVKARKCLSNSLPVPNAPGGPCASLNVAPGLTEFTRIFRGANSFASTPVTASRPALLAAYTEKPGGCSRENRRADVDAAGGGGGGGGGPSGPK